MRTSALLEQGWILLSEQDDLRTVTAAIYDCEPEALTPMPLVVESTGPIGPFYVLDNPWWPLVLAQWCGTEPTVDVPPLFLQRLWFTVLREGDTVQLLRGSHRITTCHDLLSHHRLTRSRLRWEDMGCPHVNTCLPVARSGPSVSRNATSQQNVKQLPWTDQRPVRPVYTVSHHRGNHWCSGLCGHRVVAARGNPSYVA